MFVKNPFFILLITICCEAVASTTKEISNPLDVQSSTTFSHKPVIEFKLHPSLQESVSFIITSGLVYAKLLPFSTLFLFVLYLSTFDNSKYLGGLKPSVKYILFESFSPFISTFLIGCFIEKLRQPLHSSSIIGIYLQPSSISFPSMGSANTFS